MLFSFDLLLLREDLTSDVGRGNARQEIDASLILVDFMHAVTALSAVWAMVDLDSMARLTSDLCEAYVLIELVRKIRQVQLSR